MRTNTTKQDLMFSLVQKYHDGELSKKEIYQNYDVTKDSFYYWKKKYNSLNDNQMIKSNKFLPLIIQKKDNQVIESEFKITYPNGVYINIPSKTDLKTISQLINML